MPPLFGSGGSFGPDLNISQGNSGFAVAHPFSCLRLSEVEALPTFASGTHPVS